MSSIKGMGSCAITLENGYPCGRQIGEGEAIGTVVINGAPYVGHKLCADSYDMRRARGNVVKRADQTSPGGAVGEFRDAMPDDGRPRSASPPNINEHRLPDGVQSLADLPMEEGRPFPPPTVPFRSTMQSTNPHGLSDEELALIVSHRASKKPEPHVITLDLSKIPVNADLHIEIKR